jgi:hypothetical protein
MAGSFGLAACGTRVPTASAPQPSTAPTSNTGVAREIANIAMGKGGLAALDNGDGQATSAYCDPSTVSHALNVSTSRSAACGINYSNGSVWKQTITVMFNSYGHPVALPPRPHSLARVRLATRALGVGSHPSTSLS